MSSWPTLARNGPASSFTPSMEPPPAKMPPTVAGPAPARKAGSSEGAEARPIRYNDPIGRRSRDRTMARDLILGTAGHIDHGKTTLVKALTGIDCDRLPEEKARGITIDIGFAILDLTPYRLGIVDVPGHE